MKLLSVVAIVTAGALAAFAIYTFGWHNKNGGGRITSPVAQGRNVYTVGEGDVVHVPVAAVRCEVSHEAGVPNFYCVHTGRTRYQVFLWKDRADLYDLARHGEPMLPTYTVPGVLNQK